MQTARARAFARDLIQSLRTERFEPDVIELDDAAIDVLHATVELIASSAASDADAVLQDASRLYAFMERALWPRPDLGEKDEVLGRTALCAWRIARRSAKVAAADRWSRRIPTREGPDLSMIREFSTNLSGLRLENPETLLAVSANLRDLSESKPLLLKEKAAFLFHYLDQPKRPIGLSDEREYFLGEFALLAGIASRVLAHREEAARWFDLADANFRLTVNPAADCSRVSYHRLAMALEERRFEQLFEQLALLRLTFDRLDMAQDSLKCRFLEGVALVESGALGRALMLFQEVVAEVARVGSQKLQAAAYVNLVHVHGIMGDTANALEASRCALSLLEGVEAREYVAKIQWGIGSLLRARGRLSASIEAYREAGSHFEQMGMQADLAATRLMIADMYLELGQDAAAMDELLLALPVIDEYKLLPEGVAALELLRESVRQQKVNHQALRDLHGFFEDRVS